MIVITRDMLRFVNTCAEGHRFGLQNEWIFGKTYDEAIQLCLDKGEQEFADFLIEHKTHWPLVQHTGGVSTGVFLVTDHVNGKILRFTSLSDAQTHCREVQRNEEKKFLDTFVANHRVVLENGAETWTPIDIDNTTHVENICVFNHINGVYEAPNSLENAKKRRQEMLEEHMQARPHLFLVFEEIKNPAGWVAQIPIETR